MLATTARRISFAEVFPIRLDTFPALYGYRLSLRGGDIATIGGKLAYRLRRMAGGHWTVSHGEVLGDTLAPPTILEEAARALKGEQPEIFKALYRIALDTAWQPAAQARADFVARALFPDLHAHMTQLLAGMSQDLGQAQIERVYVVRGWVVAGEPAISLSISSRLMAKQPFATFARQAHGDDALRGIWVGDTTSSLKGQIVEVTGTVGDLRDHLLSLTQREEMRQLIERAPADERVVCVRAGRTSYEYAASALRVIIRTEDYGRFGIDARQAMQALRITPKERSDLVAKVAQIAKDARLIAPNAYRSVHDGSGLSGQAKLFLTSRDVGFAPRIRLGDGSVVFHNERNLSALLADHGLYRPLPTGTAGAPLRIALLHALAPSMRPAAASFLQALRHDLHRFGVETMIVAEEALGGEGRADIERAYAAVTAATPDLLVPLLPFTYTSNMSAAHEAWEWGAYEHLKSLAIGHGLPSQVVTQRSLLNAHALGNITLGVLSKAGAVPFVLAEPLPYADIVVGIDIARRRKDRLAGSLNATAIARIYLNDGDFLRYVIHDAPLEGETIPRDVLQRLFPLHEFQGKRVVIHRDGLFRGDEAAALSDWGRSIGATFHLVEVIKTGTPRLYESAEGVVLQPEKGTALRLNEREAFLVSSLPPFRSATPNPLHLRTSEGFPIEQAIHSALSLTVLYQFRLGCCCLA
jgi:hypothetical protein